MHSCCYCSDSTDDLTEVANMLARILSQPQVIGQPTSAKARAAQYEGVRRDFSAINLCLAVRHLAQFPTSPLDKPTQNS